MHHYGPYSSDIDDDLAMLKSLGAINIEPDPEGYGFHVSACTPSPKFLKGYKRADLNNTIKDLTQEFGDKTASELELLATTHYITRILPGQTKQSLVETVRLLKPKFNSEQLEEAYQCIQSLGPSPSSAKK